MPNLTVTTEESELPSGELMVIGSLTGSLNITNLADFENRINSHIKKGLRFFCFDLAKLDYINSTGMGLLVKISDNLAETGGRIHLYNLSKRIESLLVMLGLTEIIHLYSSRNEAVRVFCDICSAEKSLFPLNTACSNCKSEIDFPEPGKYRCPVCNEYFDVLEDGELVSLSSTRLRLMELKIPLDRSFIQGVQSLSEAMAQNVGLTSELVETLGQVIDEFCSYLILKQESKKGIIPLLNLMLVADKEEVRLIFRGQNKLIENLEEELSSAMSLKIINTLMDDIQVVNSTNGRQLVSIVKRVPSHISS
ncbi:STAS domain-containing protein [Planctomycetota bacterium]